MVPERVKIYVEKFSTTAKFWKFMDIEFGDKDELVCDHLANLRDYKHSKEARSDAQNRHGIVPKLPHSTLKIWIYVYLKYQYIIPKGT